VKFRRSARRGAGEGVTYGQGSESFNQVGQQVVGRSLNSFPVRVLVTHDLVLEPYKG
jgi:hypothetical protein